MAANGTDSKTTNHPALYQSVTHHHMKNLMKIYHPTAAGSDTCAHSSAVMPAPPLSYKELVMFHRVQNNVRRLAVAVQRTVVTNQK